jgi:hypothetical protein
MVQDDQQMLKGDISVLLNSLNYPDMLRHPNANSCAAATPVEPQSTSTRDADETGVAYEERVTPWRWHLDAETFRGNLMSTIKKPITTPLSICWLSCTGLEKCSVQLSIWFILRLKPLNPWVSFVCLCVCVNVRVITTIDGVGLSGVAVAGSYDYYLRKTARMCCYETHFWGCCETHFQSCCEARF